MITLGIETSCDETAVSVVEGGKVLSSEVSSSVHLHSEYGGVVPEIASRFHTEYIYPVFNKALADAGIKSGDIELVCVTNGPGLPGSLLIGLAFAKALSLGNNIPILGIDHLKAHIFSSLIGKLRRDSIEDAFPMLGMIISGGHTAIYKCDSVDDCALIGRTRDDAAGEAYDKVAKVMGLGYPGGPVIESIAGRFGKQHDTISFTRALMEDPDDLDFSFSGLKTAVLYHWQKSGKNTNVIEKTCYAFQEAVMDMLIGKLERALRLTGIKKIALGGGVLNNDVLRSRIEKMAEKKKTTVLMPEKKYCSDNAAMVAFLGEIMFLRGKRSDLSLKMFQY